jgi:hypothetical protein
MLVRRSHVKSGHVGTYFDAEEAMKLRDLHSYEWKEFLVIWRKDQLELYEDYVSEKAIPIHFLTHDVHASQSLVKKRYSDTNTWPVCFLCRNRKHIYHCTLSSISHSASPARCFTSRKIKLGLRQVLALEYTSTGVSGLMSLSSRPRPGHQGSIGCGKYGKRY